MADQRGTLDVVATALNDLLRPLDEQLGEDRDIRGLFAQLGLQFPPATEAHSALAGAASASLQRIQSLAPTAAALAAAVSSENVPMIIAKGLELATAVASVIDEIDKVGTALKTAGAGAGIPAAELNAFADELPQRLIDFLVVRKIEAVPGVAQALEFLGVVERTSLPAVDPQHPAFIRRKMHINELTNFVKDPLAHLQAKYQWGSPGFTGSALLAKINSLLVEAGVPSILDTTGPVPVLDAIVLEIRPKTDVNPPGLILKLAHQLDIDTTAPFVQDDWQFRVVTDAALSIGAQAVFQPNDQVTFTAAGGARTEGELLLEWTGGKTNGEPYVILGQAGGSRLQAQQFIVKAGVGLAWDSGQNVAHGAFKISGEVKQGKLVISLAGADGFIGKILGGFGLESDFNVGVGFSTQDGLVFEGAASLEIQLPVHVSLGPVELTALTFTVGISDAAFPVGLRADLKGDLGPLKASVRQIGVGVSISLPADQKGNIGPVDVKLDFLPPKGVGLSLDAAVIKGGGFLDIDKERGEYAGMLELVFSGFINLKAIGIITTKMPDGSTGFSLLIIITAEFATGIQLGFGFTLLAVGGLIGLNRTMNLQALTDGVRTGSINSVMFPKDIVANAPRIISDLRTIFPVREGTFLIGPMAKLGWGTPTLISLSLGIIIEIPGNIAILGVLRVAIPADDVALIVLQVSFVGGLEFDKKRLWFFAGLFESRIIFLTIDGELGLLVAFGGQADFVVSVGGFHPSFNPPPLPFPSPKRISVSLLNTPVARLKVEGYFAVTSNTVQFGARVDVFFGLSILNVKGHLAFDALFQFSPFHFVIQISASLSVNVFGAGLFSVGIRGSLDGPAPWHVKGSGSISLLFWDVDVDFEETWGERRDTMLPPISVLPILAAEINKAENWIAALPAGNNLMVSLRKLPSAEAGLVLHPLGMLHVSQRHLPLGIKLDKVGNQKPNDVNRLSVEVSGGGLAKVRDAFEQFAPAQFQDFSDSDKLSKPAFAPERSGVDLSSSGGPMQSSVAVKRVVRYEEIIIDNNFRRFQRRFRGYFGVLFNLFLNGSAITNCEYSQAAKKKLQPFEEKIDVAPETFAVAFHANNKAFSPETVSFQSEASAREYMNGAIGVDASLADEIHVIPTFETAA